MPNEPKHFTVVDPRTADGDPYEVAVRGVAQLEGLVFIAIEQIEAAKILALNAGLERDLAAGRDPNPKAWHESYEGRAWALTEIQLNDALKNLKNLKKAAGFNPRAPLPAFGA